MPMPDAQFLTFVEDFGFGFESGLPLRLAFGLVPDPVALGTAGDAVPAGASASMKVPFTRSSSGP